MKDGYDKISDSYQIFRLMESFLSPTSFIWWPSFQAQFQDILSVTTQMF